jgi:N-succinyldiaminopimelate aminotransferase
MTISAGKLNRRRNGRLQQYATTIFAEMTELAVQHDAVNLGQGFPDEDGPAAMLQCACQAIMDGYNQYPPATGTRELRAAIARDRLDRMGEDIDPDSQVLVTVGATEALAAAVLGLIEPGSEVIVFEPYYDSYAAAITMAGAKMVAVSLTPDGDGFALDVDALARAITPNTAALIVNSPHNPTGAVISHETLSRVAELAERHDLLVISDDVYERFVFDGRSHHTIAGINDMSERTITISSAAKTFNCTGWKIGWACGASQLIARVRTAKQHLSYAGGAPFQPAVALALQTEGAWVDQQRRALQRRRDRLRTALRRIGFEVHRSDGGYFVCADPRPLGFADSAAFCRQLPEKIGVAGIPVSAFCNDHADRWQHLVRFSFAKSDGAIDTAIARLTALTV